MTTAPVRTAAADGTRLDPVARAVADIAAGRPVVVVDDEDRENEGDLVVAAESATPETVAFMMSECRGLICAPMDGADLDRLGLPQMVEENTETLGTAFTVSVDATAAHGVTTGISGADRSRTLRLLADPAARPADFARPGHVFPLRARPGGVLARAGHTEAAVDLARLAGLRPAGAIVEIAGPDGTMLRLPQLIPFARRHGLAIISIADLITHRRGTAPGRPAGDGPAVTISGPEPSAGPRGGTGPAAGTGPAPRTEQATGTAPAVTTPAPPAGPVPSAARTEPSVPGAEPRVPVPKPLVPGAAPAVRRAAEVRLPTAHGPFTAYGYRSTADGLEHVALVHGDLGDGEETLVRMHSECLTGDVLGSLRCDCGPQLQTAMARIAAEGRGVVVYLRGHEGRGIGLLSKLRAYELQERGRDTLDANLELGLPVDARDYGAGAQILADLGVRSVRLMTNNPDKTDALLAHGIEVTGREPMAAPTSEDNLRYLRTKRDRMGHDLPWLDAPAMAACSSQ